MTVGSRHAAFSLLPHNSRHLSRRLCRLLVEKIFAQYMVPHSLDTEEKMKCLYYLYACLDTNAVKSVNLQYSVL